MRVDDAALGGVPLPQSVHSAERRAQRLQAWVERDLRALLQVRHCGTLLARQLRGAILLLSMSAACAGL